MRPAASRLVGGVGVLVLLIGCSSNGDDSAPTTLELPAISAPTTVGPAPTEDTSDLELSIAASLAAIDEEGAIRFSSAEASCTASRVVDSIGARRLLELGADQNVDLTALDWTPDERDLVFHTLGTCVDLTTQVAEFLSADGSLTATEATCVAGLYVASEVFPDALFSTEPDPVLDNRVDDALTAASESCH